jgi:hypothetical protein
MTIRIYRSRLQTDVCAFARDEAFLPVRFEPWEPEGNAAFPMHGSGLPGDITEALEREGFYLFSTEPEL